MAEEQQQQQQQQHGFQPQPGGAWGPKPVRKRLIVCCDGTWQAANHATHEIPSNIAKLCRAISKTYIDENGLAAPQIVFYDAGVATANWLDEKISGWLGSGLDENVCEAYNFLASNYLPGDEVFFFGFSRGAYTARATAGLVARVGICQDIQMSRFWEMYSIYKTKEAKMPIEDTAWGKPNPAIADKAEKDLTDNDMVTISEGDKEYSPYKVRKGAGADWLSYCHKPVDIKIVGVFDTVGSVGFPENKWIDVSKWNKPYAFHNTDIHPEFENAFHALGLDERRAHMKPTLWNMPGDNQQLREKIGLKGETNLIQCWFPGVHVNVGGGSEDGLKRTPKGDLESMANTTFAWMVDRCRPYLHFEEKVLNFITAQYFEVLSKLTSRSNETQKVGWGVGPYQKDFKGLVPTVIGEEVRTPGYYPDKPDTREYIHPVVFHAQQSQNYASKALEGFKRISNGDEQGYSWLKSFTPKDVQSWSEWAGSIFNRRTVKKDAQSVTVTIKEFVIPKMVIQQGSYSQARYYSSPLERLLILRDQWTEDQTKQAFESEEQYLQRKTTVLEKQPASDYLMQLDKDNRNTKYIGESVTWGTEVKQEEKPSGPFSS